MFDDRTDDEILRMAEEMQNPPRGFGGASVTRSRFSLDEQHAIATRAAAILAARKSSEGAAG